MKTTMQKSRSRKLPTLLGIAWISILGLAAGPGQAADDLNCEELGAWGRGTAMSAAAQGNTLCFSSGRVLRVMDITSPALPADLGALLTPGLIQDLVPVGDLVYLANWAAGLSIVDLSDPTAPLLMSTLDLPYHASNLAVAGDHVYVAAGGSGLRIVDASDSANPVEVADFPIAGYCTDVAVQGNLAYVLDRFSDLYVLDVSDPAAPVELGSVAVPTNAEALVVEGDIAYIAARASGLVLIDVALPASPSYLVEFDILGSAWDIDKDGDHVFLASNTQGMHIVNVFNPGAMYEVANVESVSGSRARRIDVSGTVAYVANDEGCQIIDVRVPANAVELELIGTPDNAQKTVMVGNIAYIANSAAGLQIVDMSDPAAPVKLGGLATPGLAYDVRVANGLAYVAAGYAGLRIIDVSNPAAPFDLGDWDDDGFVECVELNEGAVYLGASLGADEAVLYVVDAVNPAAPFLAGSLATADEAGEMARDGDLLYLAAGYAGLLIVDVDDPFDPVLISSVAPTNFTTGLALSGDTVFLTDVDYDLRAIDVSDPVQPALLDDFESDGSLYTACVSDGMLYVGGFYELYIFDAGNPAYLEQLGFRNLVDSCPGLAAGDGFVVASCYRGGIAALGFSGGTAAEAGQAPSMARITGLHPNPFNPSTRIAFTLAKADRVSLRVLNVAGRQVRRLLTGENFSAGHHELSWNGRDDRGRPLPSGAYFVSMRSSSGRDAARTVLIK